MLKYIKHMMLKFNELSNRSKLVLKSIIGIYTIKAVNVLISLIYIPIMLNILGQNEFGIWITINTIVTWITFLDLGIGSGLRVKLTKSISEKDNALSKQYVSSAYYAIAGISFLILISIISVIIIVNPITEIFAIQDASVESAIYYYGLYFILRLNFQLIQPILITVQKSATAALLDLTANLISLTLLFIISEMTEYVIKISDIALIYSIPSVIIFISYSIFIFSTRLSHIGPNISMARYKYFKILLPIGINYFIIQMSSLVIFSTDNILIAYYLGPEKVALYSVVFRYFNIPFMVFNIISVPVLSGIADAYFKNDTLWILKIIDRIRKYWIFISGIVIIMAVISQEVLTLWVGENITSQIPVQLIVIMGVWIILKSWNNIYVNFLNGVGIIKLSMYSSVYESIVNIILNIVLLKYTSLGLVGVIAASCISIIDGVFMRPLQYNKILNKTAFGIWKS
jgi:O-antigen/teichoic acid export membrane protein